MRKQKLILFLILMHLGAKAQENPIAPWVSGEGTNQNLNTGNILSKDLSTGIGSIAIPFYSYNASGVDLGVSLNYTTEAIQVDQIASNVGLNWDISTGGYIEREIRDFPDDEKFNAPSSCGSFTGKNGYWFQNFSCPTLDLCDNESDIFYAVFGSRSVKFLFSKNGDYMTIPKMNINIERFINGVPFSHSMAGPITGGNASFVITDETGNKFYYKSGTVNEEAFVGPRTSRDTSCEVIHYPTTKWVLEKVVSYEGATINYVYESDLIVDKFHEAQSVMFKQTDWYPPNNSFESKDKRTIARLLRIEYPNNINVSFSYDRINSRCDAEDLRLTEIAIFERTVTNTTSITQRYIFQHGYFSSPWRAYVSTSTSIDNNLPLSSGTGSACDSNRLRLRLNGIQYQTNLSQPVQYYSFNYSAMPLPVRLYGSRDLYGHTNEYNIGISVCPTDYHGYWVRVSYAYGGPPIACNFGVSSTAYVEASMLKKITNGQGGQIEINYTSNQYGSLMLDEIKSFDGYNHDNDIVAKYTYNTFEYLPASTISYSISQFDGIDTLYYTNVLNSTAQVNEGLNRGRVIFTDVTEDIKDRNNNFLKSNHYKFSGFGFHSEFNDGNSSNGLNSNSFPGIVNLNYTAPPYTNKQYRREWGIGLPLSTENYDNNHQLIKKETYKYEITEDYIALNNANYKHTAKLAKKFDLTQLGRVMAYYTDEYYPITGQAFLKEKTTQEYFSNTSANTFTTTYTYDSKGNLSTEIFTNSRNQSVKTEYHYNYVHMGATGMTALNKLNTDNAQRLFYSETWRNGKLVSAVVPGWSIVTGNVVRPSFLYSLAADAPLSSGISNSNLATMSNGGSVTNFRLSTTISKYDNKGNALQTAAFSANKYSSSIWDEVTGTQLASVLNAGHNEIAYCGFESEYALGSAFTKGNWGFNEGAITSQNSLLGRKAYHLVPNGGLYSTTSLIKDKPYIVSVWMKDASNAHVGMNTCDNQAIQLDSIDNYNGWTLYRGKFTILTTCGIIGVWCNGNTESYIDELRLYPFDAAMTNVNFTPLLGKTSDVDANDRIVTYEYDALGNLHITRDHNRDIISKIDHVIQGVD